MEEKMRKTGINVIGDAYWGTHFCLFYQGKQDLLDILPPYFKAGLENNECCIWVTSEPLGEKQAQEAMRKAVPNFDRYLKRGQMEIIPHTEWYLKNGSFDLQRVLNAWIDKLNQALLKGYDGLRVTGNTAWLEKRDWRNYTDYEEEVKKTIGDYQMMILCTYSLDKCGASDVIDVLGNHQAALIRQEGKWKLIESSQPKRVKEALEESEERYRLLAESMSDVIWTTDMKLNFTYISPSVTRMLGYSSEEVMAQTLEETLGLRSFRTLMKLVEEEKRKEMRKEKVPFDSETIELELNRKDGSTVWAETRIIFLPDAYGWSREILGVMRDVTASKKAEQRIGEYTKKLTAKNKQLREETRKTKEAEEKTREYAEQLKRANLQLKAETERAQEADRLKSEFLANMSHEIRTPLTVIDGAAHLLQKNSPSPEQRDLLAMIRGSGQQLMEIINAILDLARIEAGQTKVVKKEFSLKESVKNIVSGFEFEARKKGLEIKMICPRHLPSMIRTDEGKLTQILSNLISNALRFTEKGRVEVRLNKESNSSIRFSVEDTGIGIPEEKLPLILSKFYQVNGTTRKERGGVGLGLTIVKELVDLLEGKIEVKSKPGKGSLFCFSLPCIPSKEKVVPDRDGSGASHKREERVKKGMNILVAEDDSSTYNIIRKFLEDCTISRAVDGEDVLRRIKEKSYDMVLMDIQMPKMDGLEATRRIREKDSDLPIIAVTARSFKADEEKCLAAGCNDYIAKPIAPEKLITKINQYAIRRTPRRQNSPPK